MEEKSTVSIERKLPSLVSAKSCGSCSEVADWLTSFWFHLVFNKNTLYLSFTGEVTLAKSLAVECCKRFHMKKFPELNLAEGGMIDPNFFWREGPLFAETQWAKCSELTDSTAKLPSATFFHRSEYHLPFSPFLSGCPHSKWENRREVWARVLSPEGQSFLYHVRVCCWGVGCPGTWG